MVSRIAHVGHDRVLMKRRSTTLRDAGFSVDEAYTLGTALNSAEAVDALLICHTLPNPDKARLVSAVRYDRGAMPIICVNSYQSEVQPEGCIGVENIPLAILDAIASATQMGTLLRQLS
jgi:DNA-binding response OmpR family regulator